MVWQKIDDQFGVSQKVIRIPRKRRQQVIGLWVLAGNYAVRTLTDGIVEQHELDEMDARPADVAELVRVGLWHPHGHGCDSCPDAPVGGIVIHDFLVYNPSREQTLASREAERVRKASYRESKRSPNGTDSGTPAGSDPVSGHPVPVPSRPVPLTDVKRDTQVSHVGDVVADSTDSEVLSLARFAGIRNLEQLHEAMYRCCGPLTGRGAVELAKAICARSKDPVENIDGYVLATIQNTPDEVRWDYERLDLGAIA